MTIRRKGKTASVKRSFRAVISEQGSLEAICTAGSCTASSLKGEKMKLKYSKEIKQQITGRKRVRHLHINWDEVKMFFAISIMPFGFLAAVIAWLVL